MTVHPQARVRRRLSLGLVACAWISLALPPAARAQMPEDIEEAAKRVVVMVTCPSQDLDQPGAGFLVGLDADRVYIVTAAHVVSRCVQGDGTRVRFRWSSAPTAGRVLNMDARPLDLAVVAVPRAAAFVSGQPPVALDRLGDPRLVRRGDPVYALGNPRGIPWGINAVPDRMASAEGDVLLFASTFIGEGHSGGVLLNDRGEILGMIRRDQPPTGEAVSVSRILDRVREWKHPVNLREPLLRLVAGRDLTCRTGAAGGAACWGDVNFENVGVHLGTLKLDGPRFRQIGLGVFHVCGLAFDGQVSCQGKNNYGQLGTGNASDSLDQVVATQQGALVFTSIAVGGWHTCGLTQPGRAFCWGSGQQGRLGNNSNDRSLAPAAVAGSLTFRALAAGLRNTCGLTAEGAAFCWGGMHGTGLERLGGAVPPIAFTPKRVSGSMHFKLVSSGGDHVCGVATTGRAFCWGGNHEGQLGSGRSSEREFQPVAVAGNHTFVSLAAGYGGDTCGITPSGSAYCWGPNVNGTHGNGTTKDSNVPVSVSGGHTFASISVGINHACGVTVDGQIYCWGGAPGAGFAGTGLKVESKVPRLVADAP